MRGSVNIHNHPPGTSQYSFSDDDDLPSFIEEGSSVMVAFDEKYVYEVRRMEKDLDLETYEKALYEAENNLRQTMVKDGVGFEDYEEQRQHILIRETCKKLGIPYERRKRSD